MTRQSFTSTLSRADHAVDRIGTVLIVVGGGVIALTVVLQVLLRYVFKVPLFGLEEFSRLVAVWVYFIGAIYGTKYDSHVQGDVAERFFRSPRAKSVVKITTWCLSLVVCALFFYHAAIYCIWIYNTGERTTGLWWPRITSVGSMFFGAFFMTLYSAVNVVRYLIQAVEGGPIQPGGDV